MYGCGRTEEESHEPDYTMHARAGNGQRCDASTGINRRTDVPSGYLAFSGMYRPVVFWNITDRCNLELYPLLQQIRTGTHN